MNVETRARGNTPADARVSLGFEAGDLLRVSLIDLSVERLDIRPSDTVWRAKITLDKPGGITLNIDECQRQLIIMAIIMAIGRLAIDRPGWEHALEVIANKIDGLAMMKQFQQLAVEEAT